MVGEGMLGLVPSASDTSTDQTLPEIGLAVAGLACDGLLVLGVPVAVFGPRFARQSWPGGKVVVCIPTDRTPAPRPFLETGAMKHVLAKDCQEPRRLVHAFEADRTRWQLDQSRRPRSQGLH